MVAAWISAETGVGPAMASGSQTKSGICADLPVAPTNNSKQTAVTTVGDHSASVGARRLMSAKPSDGVPSCAETPEEQEHADQEGGVADAVGDEGLAAGDGVGHVRVPEADQQVGAQADAFPADEQQRQRVAQHQHQHRGGEQVHIGEEARDVRILVHVAERVDVDQEADAGDDQDHHAGQRVDAEGHLERQRRRLDPGVQVVEQRAPAGPQERATVASETRTPPAPTADRPASRATARPSSPRPDRGRADQRAEDDPAQEGGFDYGHY